MSNTEKQQLIVQMGSRDYKIALEAVETLRERGWLQDGSLRDADLRVADLRTVNLQGANLDGVKMSAADLRNADLSESSLRNANLSLSALSSINLSKADLTDTNLLSVDLTNANLAHAKMQGVDLRGADLSGANLQGVDLSGANLYRANLYRAILHDANLTDATCRSTVFVDVDLSTVSGLETVQHEGPSSLGIDTLFKSKGVIPASFLRGCGVPETLIAYLDAHPMSALDKLQCFVSHSTVDQDFAKTLDEKLNDHGIRCWLYQRDMNPKEGPREGMRRGFDDSDVMLLCCSKDSLGSQYVYEEIGMALDKEGELFKQNGVPTNIMVVLDLDGFIFSPDCHHALRSQIRAHQIIDFKAFKIESKFTFALEQLLRHLGNDQE